MVLHLTQLRFNSLTLLREQCRGVTLVLGKRRSSEIPAVGGRGSREERKRDDQSHSKGTHGSINRFEYFNREILLLRGE